MKHKTKEINLPKDAEETVVSQGEKDAAPRLIKGTSWGHSRSKAAMVNPAARV